MVKKGRLNEVEKFFIVNNKEEMSVEMLAEKLDRTVELVQKCLDTIPKKKKSNVVVEEQPVEADPPKKPESPIFKLMGRHERNGQKVATVMTRAASEYADSTRPQRLEQKQSLKNAIHKPKG